MGDIPPSPNRPDREGLFQLASEQRGYFTAAQARDYGYSRALLAYHAKAGTLQRAYAGIYRFRDYPTSPREEIIPAWLLVGKDVAVVSHESALELWNLSDIIPDGVHLSVPRSRRHLPTLPGVRIHTTTRSLDASNVRNLEGIRVTNPTRTLLDILEANVSLDQVGLALAQATSRGWISPRRLRDEAAIRGPRSILLVEEALAATPLSYRELA